MLTKQEIRAKMLQQRQQLTSSIAEKASLAASKLIEQQSWFQQSSNIAFYLASKNELSIYPLIEVCWQQNKNCYLPIVHRATKVLDFAKYAFNQPLKKNKFKIYEPTEPHEIIAPAKLDLILIPTVAATIKGLRLGHGFGYYDATIATITNDAARPKLISLCYDFQIVTSLPQDKWDPILDGIVTEKTYYEVNK